ncbi:MAG: hypothetical protein QW775_02160 [Ignisphaera sp.]|uniref:Uncharacterized protein n=1 Tax=Ignisphaera aggregans TaxID=334771 RepID=A0A7C4NKR3_9CREN
MYVKGQSELLTVIMYIGLALVVGVTMLSYFSSVISSYNDQVLLSNHIQYEASNVIVNVISYDVGASTLWLLLKRVDGSRNGFFIAVDTGSQYISCSKIYVYYPHLDDDGILCNSNNDCVESITIFSGSMDKVYIPWEGSLSDFLSYSKAMGYTIGNMHICRIENICAYSDNTGICNENIIAKLNLPGDTKVARIFIVTLYSNKPYIVGLYEVLLE